MTPQNRCPTCRRRIFDMDDDGFEWTDGQRWCLPHWHEHSALEPLVADGARYSCGYHSMIRELHLCPRDAIGSIPAPIFEQLKQPYAMGALEGLSHRSVCATHAKHLIARPL